MRIKQSDDDITDILSNVTQAPTDQSKPDRFVQCDEFDLSRIANNRVSKNTKEQTRWAVAIMRGKISFYFLVQKSIYDVSKSYEIYLK